MEKVCDRAGRLCLKKINSLSVIEVLMEKNNPIYWILFVNTNKNIYIKYGSKNIFLSLIND